VASTSTDPVRRRPKPTHHPELAKKPHIKVVEYAREIMGDRAAVALEAISNPRSRMHSAIGRNRGFVLVMITGSILGSFIGGRLLGLVPSAALLPIWRWYCCSRP
jgi:hypothetical protein